MVLNGGRAVVSGSRKLGIVFALLAALFAFTLLSDPAWAQQGQRQVSEERQAQIEGLSDAQAEDQFLRAAQTSDSSGDLAGERATVNDAGNVVIEEADCTVSNNATITFRDDGGNVVGVANDEDGITINSNDRRVIVSGSSDITAGDGPLTVLSSTGIDCGDPDNDDGFDDELLLLLLLELLEDDDGDDGDGGDGDGGDGDGNGDGDDGDGDGEEGDEGELDADTDGDGIVSQQEQEAAEAEEDLNGEDTDGEDTLGEDTLGDESDGDPGAFADSSTGEASTPGAVAQSDPDEQAPVSEEQAEEQGGDVVDEVETEGPLPETGGASVAAGTSLALVLFGVSLLALRLVSARRGGRT